MATSDHTLLLIVRHGDPARGPVDDAPLIGWTDVPLSERGLRQAEQVMLRLRDEPVRAPIYTSSLRRAEQTAAVIGGATGLPLVPLRCLREIRCGTVDGWPASRVQREFPSRWRANLAQDDVDFRWPGGESYLHFRARTVRGVGAIACRHPGEPVIVVTHAGVVTQLLGSIRGVSPARWETFRPAHASLTLVEWQGARGVLRRFDDREHLEEAESRAV